jgi:hypothetical protein
MVDIVLIARSSPECHLYIELHPCACGETQLETKHVLQSSGDDLVAVYQGVCPSCSTARRFDLVLDPEIPPGDKFGGPRPSTLIDAGQYLAVADDASKRVPGDTANLTDTERRAARWWMNRAVNALEEVLKFVPPAGDAVPSAALFTSAGKEVYLKEPGRFRKRRLEAVLGVYRDLLAKLGDA